MHDSQSNMAHTHTHSNLFIISFEELEQKRCRRHLDKTRGVKNVNDSLNFECHVSCMSVTPLRLAYS